MKLAIVTAYPPSKIALNEYAYHLVKYFRQKKNITELVLLTDETKGKKNINFTEGGCKITVKECWKFNSYTNVFNITRTINKVKPDAVLFNLQFMKFGDKKVAAALGLMLPFICKLKNTPNIVLLHNILEEVDIKNTGFTSYKITQKIYGFIRSILIRLILQSDIVAVTMDKFVTVLQSKYKAKNIKLIPHGTFEMPKEPNYDIATEHIQIMTFGKFGTYKKVEGMIEAVDKVRKSTGLNLEIVIAGTDSSKAPGYLAKVKKDYKHIPKVRFTGYVEEHEVPTLFNESAVVVFPYTSITGSSGVLHQAGSYGRAVVIPNLEDLAHLIKDEGYRGEFFDSNCVDSLARAIKNIVTNENYRKMLAKANYKAATEYPMSKITDMYLDSFYEIMIKKNKPDSYLIKDTIL